MIGPNLALQHLPVHFQEGWPLFAVAFFAAAGIKKEKKKVVLPLVLEYACSKALTDLQSYLDEKSRLNKKKQRLRLPHCV